MDVLECVTGVVLSLGSEVVFFYRFPILLSVNPVLEILLLPISEFLAILIKDLSVSISF